MQQAAGSAPVPLEKSRDALRQPNRPRLKDNETIAAYLFLTPYLIVLCVFILFSMVYGVGLSFYKVDIGFTTPQFIGLRNYEALWRQLAFAGDSDFWISMLNILKYTVVVVIGTTILALVLAVLLYNTKWYQGFFRTAFFLPSVTSAVAIAIIFLWFYTPQGIINYLLSLVHIQGPKWLEDPNTALPAIMIMNIWTTAATFMIYFLAALQDIPRDLYEAGSVDGADKSHLFWYITLPLLRPAMFLVVALGTIGAFQVFDQIKIMTEGGPLKSTLSPVYVIYNTGFGNNQFGLAAAMSVILFILIFIVTIFQRRFIDIQ